MVFARAALLACLALWPTAVAAQVSFLPGAEARVDGITRLVDAVEKAANAGDAGALRALGASDLEQGTLDDFVRALTSPAAARATVKERDRAATTSGIRLLIETFLDRGGEGRVASWRLDVEPRGAIDGPWAISTIERLSIVSGLYRLGLDGSGEYDVRNLTIRVPDLVLTVPSGVAFLARTPDGPTGLVLLGKGHLEFSPKPEAERGQV